VVDPIEPGFAGPAVAFALLGPLEARIDGRPVDLGGAKQRALLAMLLLDANRPVSIERVLDGLWDEPPNTALKSVQVYVSRLRRTLQGASERIETTQAGYLLRAGPDEIDLQRFKDLAASGHEALPEDPATAAAKLREALSLWRGAPIADLASEPLASVVGPQLEEQRLRAIETRMDADLALGRHGELVGELHDLVARYPFRERFCAQLMLSLYKSGRQAESLEVYQDARTVLADELGIEPGPELQRLHTAVLRQDPSLESPGPRLDGVPEEGTDAGATSQAPPQTELEAEAARAPIRLRGGLGRRRLGVAATTLVVVGALIALALARDNGSRPPRGPVSVRPNSVAIVEPRTDSVVADIPVGDGPGPIAISGNGAWVGNVGDRTISRIEVRTHAVVKTFGLPQTPVSLTAGPGVVWIGNGFDGTLSRILTSYDQLSSPFFPGPPVHGLLAVATSPTDLWIGLATNRVLRLDPASLEVRRSFPVPHRLIAIAVTAGAVWTVQFYDDDVLRINPKGRIVETIPLPSRPQAIAAGDGGVWVATADGRLWRIDATTGEIGSPVPLGLTATAIAVQSHAVWVIGGSHGVLERIDPQNGELVRTLDVGRPLSGLAIANGDVWVTAG
jgi:DNA-binding SARP family transcriptional activator/streptogramin lyase